MLSLSMQIVRLALLKGSEMCVNRGSVIFAFGRKGCYWGIVEKREDIVSTNSCRVRLLNEFIIEIN